MYCLVMLLFLYWIWKSCTFVIASVCCRVCFVFFVLKVINLKRMNSVCWREAWRRLCPFIEVMNASWQSILLLFGMCNSEVIASFAGNILGINSYSIECAQSSLLSPGTARTMAHSWIHARLQFLLAFFHSFLNYSCWIWIYCNK